jgi:hypothetical protein
MAWRPRLDEALVVAVRAAVGRPPELAKRFGLPPNTIWRIKRGISGAHVSYTHTVLLPRELSGGRGSRASKLSEEQRACIECDLCRSREASEEHASKFGVTPSRVNEIWLELDFMAAHWAAVSKTDAEMVARSVGKVEPHADVPLGDRH